MDKALVRNALQGMIRATDDDSTPIIRRLARVQARAALETLDAEAASGAGEREAMEQAAHILGRVSISHMVGKCGWKSHSQAEAGMREVLAALAAAPTIPATGHAATEGERA